MERTYFAVLTPPGRGGIATVALSGPAAWTIARELVALKASQRLPLEPQPGKVWFGRVGNGVLGYEEVVVTARDARLVELHCHGGSESSRMLQELFKARGADVCSWQELERRTETDSLAAQAFEELTKAATPRTASILLDQYRGSLKRALDAIQLAVAEGATDRGINLIEQLLSCAELGRHLTDPWHVVIAGAANVGKSSLVNALAGFQRSIVSPEPGTTRDVVTCRLAIDGWPVEVADTAGWRESEVWEGEAPAEPGDALSSAGASPSPDSVEREGIDRANAATREADLCLWVLDASATPVFSAKSRYRYVINKIDLPVAWDLSQFPEAIKVSAKTGEGIDGLMNSISRWLVPNPPPPGAPVPFSDNAIRLITEARTRLLP